MMQRDEAVAILERGGLPAKAQMWQQGMDARMLKEIGHARVYAEYFAHGALGHNIMFLVAKMAEHLDVAEAYIETLEETIAKLHRIAFAVQDFSEAAQDVNDVEEPLKGWMKACDMNQWWFVRRHAILGHWPPKEAEEAQQPEQA